MIEVFIAISAAAGIGALVANTYGLSLTFVVLTWVVVVAISIVYVLYFLFYGRLRRIRGAFQQSKGEGTDSPLHLSGLEGATPAVLKALVGFEL